MLKTATALSLTEYDAQCAVDIVNGSRWDALTQDYWWRGVMMSHDRYTDRPVVCVCCDVAVSSFRHTVEQCRTWSMLWQWAQDTCRQAGQPIPGTVRRQEWMAFGVGIYGAHDDGWTVRHDVAAMIWGAVMYAIRVVEKGVGSKTGT